MACTILCLFDFQELARLIVRVSKECHIEIEEDTYIDHFKPYLMDACFAWCNGSSFLEVCRKTDIFEGNLVLHHATSSLLTSVDLVLTR